jgi:hypothetical protein
MVNMNPAFSYYQAFLLAPDISPAEFDYFLLSDRPFCREPALPIRSVEHRLGMRYNTTAQAIGTNYEHSPPGVVLLRGTLRRNN